MLSQHSALRGWRVPPTWKQVWADRRALEGTGRHTGQDRTRAQTGPALQRRNKEGDREDAREASGPGKVPSEGNRRARGQQGTASHGRACERKARGGRAAGQGGRPMPRARPQGGQTGCGRAPSRRALRRRLASTAGPGQKTEVSLTQRTAGSVSDLNTSEHRGLFQTDGSDDEGPAGPQRPPLWPPQL